MKLISKTTRYRLEAALARAMFAILGALPLDWASGLVGALARAVGPRLKVSRMAKRNLARCFPEKNAAEIHSILVQVWDNLGRVAGEFPHMGELVKDRVEVVGVEHLHAARDDGLGALFISAHLGNWEIPGAVAARHGLPVTLVYRAANNPWVEDLYRKGRTVTAVGGQVAKGPEGARELLTILRKGGHVGMLVDQKMNDGIAVPFFGRDAMTAPATAKFALKFRCPVIPLRVERLGGAHFRLSFLPPMALPQSGDARADTMALMTEINVLIEQWVRERPGQWLWLHKRWPE